ncbi:twin-arginine translocation signal domain-containing protein [Halomonas sp. IOP_14]|uniref:LPS-assembly lipoprotein LptE n=1 Tax=Halomonadaceae TaxID=28256 RepID=UPI00168129B6|nr:MULTISPECIES: twin-arginine translocation signal domain-containing protein [Halomonas]MCD1587429.1 twin-arginine translocation signal domain-containing protein [Halomonas sp. IOP_14]QNU61170.1 twin-arginine translocation signal domain-containing protein [Halomonas titanicae]
MNRRTFLTASIAASAAVLVSGCGFRLRGSESLPTLPPLALEGDTNSAVAQQIASRLQQLGTQVAAGAPWRVTLGTPVLTERRLGGDGRASREHELTLSARLSVQERASNAYHINNETLSTDTRIRVSDDDLLNRETLMMEAEQTLARQLSQQIIERLTYVEGMQ